jgi:hypothetical protein
MSICIIIPSYKASGLSYQYGYFNLQTLLIGISTEKIRPWPRRDIPPPQQANVYSWIRVQYILLVYIVQGLSIRVEDMPLTKIAMQVIMILNMKRSLIQN